MSKKNHTPNGSLFSPELQEVMKRLREKERTDGESLEELEVTVSRTQDQEMEGEPNDQEDARDG